MIAKKVATDWCDICEKPMNPKTAKKIFNPDHNGKMVWIMSACKKCGVGF